ncbi:hypothetical protein G3N95_37595 [Paraburkholderia sp. Tr-20389]|uniref:hypothetical protein n=1 Tax=Paraburkholderia sp. Tr-20389 TaxID=2703903 RepID=UPI00197EA3E0|nr:hypothetical protein [Paraburkholderia sp. Tr-20389]MBN3758675.1 hypothetical protein [Paraburkholderia sp. Tr-20389]
MKTETRKIAGIATMLCGSMVTFGAHAFEQSAPAAEAANAPDVAGGTIEPLVMRDTAASIEVTNAPDAITQAVVDTLSSQKPRAFADDADGMHPVPVSYAAPIAVVTPRKEAADEAVGAAPVVPADIASDTVINEASYAVDPAPSPSVASPQGSDVLAQRDAVEQRDATTVESVIAQKAEHAVKPLPVSYAAPIAAAARKADQAENTNKADKVDKAEQSPAPREQHEEQRAQSKPMQSEALTLDATPTPPPVSPAHAEPVANEAEIVKPPVSYARPIAVPVKREAKEVASAPERTPPQTSPQASSRTSLKEAPASVARTQSKAPVSYAAPIAVPQVPQSARNDTPPGANRELKAQASAEDPNWSSKTTVALSEEKLDTMRGGFDVANGLKVSFGISRMAVVNGNLVTQTSFNIPDLSNMTTQQAQALAAANMGSLLQNGGGNIAQQGSVPGLSGAVIQNTLSNQNIQTLTTINAAVNSLGLFKNMNVGATLNNALMNSVRPR